MSDPADRLAEVFRRLPDDANPEAITGANGSVLWELPSGSGVERYGVVVTDGVVHIEHKEPAAPDATLRCAAPDALKIISGEVHPAIMVLDGRLTITGDEAFAVRMLGWFDVPAGVDPAGVDPAEVARVVAATDQREIRARLRGGIRALLVEEIIHRLPEYVDAAAARGIDAVVGWEITGGDTTDTGEADRFFLTLAGGVASAGRERTGPVRVTLRLDAADFLVLATGNGDPATMVLSGALELDGDAAFVLELARCLRVPTARGTAGLGGPEAVDIGAVARLVGRVPETALRKRLRGPVRRILLDEIFGRMPDYLNPERSRGVNALVQWQITGREDGGFDEFRTKIENGSCTVGPDLPGTSSVSIRVDPVVFVKLVTSNANPVTTFLSGKVSIKGDLLFAGRLSSIFDVPGG